MSLVECLQATRVLASSRQEHQGYCDIVQALKLCLVFTLKNTLKKIFHRLLTFNMASNLLVKHHM